MTNQEVLEYFSHVDMMGSHLGLTRMAELLEKVGSPEKRLKFVHVAGTNGKGSTAALLDACLRKAGLRVGLYTSPHLMRYNERFRINGQEISDELLAAAEERGYDLKKIVTIASLIEKETAGTDQGLIASVIYNRLEGSGDKGGTYGLLQIDASLLYALPDHTGAITSEDLQTDSPYNLYKYAGLPPTPIANPGLAAIEAALEPEQSNYYYYALGKDGKHHFFATLSEHTAFVNSSEYGG